MLDARARWNANLLATLCIRENLLWFPPPALFFSCSHGGPGTQHWLLSGGPAKASIVMLWNTWQKTEELCSRSMHASIKYIFFKFHSKNLSFKYGDYRLVY